MSKFNIPATRIIYCEEAFADGAAAGGAQGIEERIANALYASDASASEEQTPAEDVIADDQNLPDDNQSEEDDVELEDPNKVSDDNDGDVTLASMLGLDDDKLEFDDKGAVVFNAVIDGETHKVPVHELVKSYQLQGHVNNKSIALENDRKEFHSIRDQAYQELATRLNGLNQLIKLNEDSLLAEYNQIDWNTLRMTEPGEWAALQQQFQQRAQHIEQVKQMAGQEQSRGQQEQDQKKAEAYQARVQAEMGKMIMDNPHWNDHTVMAKEIGEVGAFLRNTYGFSDEEIANNIDSRLMKMFRDAMQFHAGAKALTEKKVKANVPKFQKPGSGGGDRPSLQKARAVKQQKDAIRQSGGSVDSIAQALLNRV